jgi:hypothetical protein
MFLDSGCRPEFLRKSQIPRALAMPVRVTALPSTIVLYGHETSFHQ